MPEFKVSENIVPISDFKAKASDWLRRIMEKRETIILTQNGKAAGVLISPLIYDEWIEKMRFIQAVEQGLTDLEEGRKTPHKAVVEQMKKRFGRQGDE